MLLLEHALDVRGGAFNCPGLHDLTRAVVAVIPDVIVRQLLVIRRGQDPIGSTAGFDPSPRLGDVRELVRGSDARYATVALGDVDRPCRVLVVLLRGHAVGDRPRNLGSISMIVSGSAKHAGD